MGCRNSRIKFRGYGYIRQNPCDSLTNEPQVSNGNCELVLNKPQALYNQPQEKNNDLFGNNIKSGLINSNLAGNGMGYKQMPATYNGLETHSNSFNKQYQTIFPNKFEQDSQPFLQHLQLDRMLPPVSLKNENVFPIAPLVAPPLAMPNFQESYQNALHVPMSPLAMPPLAMPQMPMPQMSMPQMPIPPMAMPQLSMPQLSMPQLSMPQMPIPPMAMPPILSFETMSPLAMPPMLSLEAIPPPFSMPPFYQSKNINLNHMNTNHSGINNLNNSNLLNNMTNLNNPNNFSPIKPNTPIHTPMPVSLSNFNLEQMNNQNASHHGRYLASNTLYSQNADFKNSYEPNFVNANLANPFCATPNSMNMRFLNPINVQ